MSLAYPLAPGLNISLDPFFNSEFSHNHCALSVGFIVQLLGCTAPHPFDSPPQRLVSDFVIASPDWRASQGRSNLLTGYKRLLRRAKNALLAMTKGE